MAGVARADRCRWEQKRAEGLIIVPLAVLGGVRGLLGSLPPRGTEDNQFGWRAGWVTLSYSDFDVIGRL